MTSATVRCTRGFTINEVIIVAGLIAVLTTVGATFIQKTMRNNSRAHARQEMTAIVTTITNARLRNRSVLGKITGTYCLMCRQGKTALKPPSEWESVQVAAPIWNVLGYSTIPTDPWNQPYLIDENEGEKKGACKKDLVISAGPDTRWHTSDDIELEIPYHNTELCPNI